MTDPLYQFVSEHVEGIVFQIRALIAIQFTGLQDYLTNVLDNR